MAHGAALKEAWAKTRTPAVGDKVAYYNMSLPCNGSVGPGPHRATVLRVNQHSIDAAVRMGKEAVRDERFVAHRGMADGPRFWDWK